MTLLDVPALAEAAARGLELAGILVVVAGVAIATFRAALRLWVDRSAELYTWYRQSLARAILLGLEILVAGDIIGTIAVDPTLTSVAVLGGIVLIRTFLSFSLEVEIEGAWPWQRHRRSRP